MVDESATTTAPDRLFDACAASLRVEHGPAPDPLYHLTDSAGLVGIIKEKCLWASLATTLNDSLEVAHGRTIATTLLETRLREHPSLYEWALLTYLRDPSTVPASHQFETDPLVISFCGRCDKSGQWLHYGRSGRGVALGFSPILAQVAKYDLVQVDYDEDSQRKKMTALIELGRKALAEEKPSVLRDQNVIYRTAHIISLYVPLLAIGMKHPSFYEEEEWRFVAHVMSFNGKRENVTGDDKSLKFRQSGERLVPYEEISFAASREMLKEVVIGHSSPLAPDAVRLMVREAQMNPRISRSSVPVR
jgi:hypothetical protein